MTSFKSFKTDALFGLFFVVFYQLVGFTIDCLNTFKMYVLLRKVVYLCWKDLIRNIGMKQIYQV